jgi:RNA polymerase sigma-70 factor (ECF subfamily)
VDAESLSRDSTNPSLLERLRQPREQAQEDWRRFVELYTPLLLTWSRRLGATGEDAADLVQDVFLQLAQVMPTFTYDRRQRFRGWLWTVLKNKWRDRKRRTAACPPAEDAAVLDEVQEPDSVAAWAEAEYNNYLVGKALELMRAECSADEWQACWEYVVQGRKADEVADELGISINQVYLAKSRVLRRLRKELEGLFD